MDTKVKKADRLIIKAGLEKIKEICDKQDYCTMGCPFCTWKTVDQLMCSLAINPKSWELPETVEDRNDGTRLAKDYIPISENVRKCRYCGQEVKA